MADGCHRTGLRRGEHFAAHLPPRVSPCEFRREPAGTAHSARSISTRAFTQVRAVFVLVERRARDSNPGGTSLPLAVFKTTIRRIACHRGQPPIGVIAARRLASDHARSRAAAGHHACRVTHVSPAIDGRPTWSSTPLLPSPSCGPDAEGIDATAPSSVQRGVVTAESPVSTCHGDILE